MKLAIYDQPAGQQLVVPFYDHEVVNQMWGREPIKIVEFHSSDTAIDDAIVALCRKDVTEAGTFGNTVAGMLSEMYHHGRDFEVRKLQETAE